jgi:hypothetical protein
VKRVIICLVILILPWPGTAAARGLVLRPVPLPGGTTAAVPPGAPQPNRSGMQCVWCSLETLGRMHGVKALYGLTKTHTWPSGPGEVAQVLRRRDVRFRQTTNATLAMVRDACERGLGCLVDVHNGRHAKVVVGFDEKRRKVWIIDNGGPFSCQIHEWSLDHFRNEFSGWVCVIYPGGAR